MSVIYQRSCKNDKKDNEQDKILKERKEISRSIWKSDWTRYIYTHIHIIPWVWNKNIPEKDLNSIKDWNNIGKRNFSDDSSMQW